MTDIPGFEGRYAADSEGNIFSLPHIRTIILRNGLPMEAEYKLKRLSPSKGRGEGLSVMLYKGPDNSRRFYVHRLIAQTFISPQLDILNNAEMDVFHIDRDVENNRVENLKITLVEKESKGRPDECNGMYWIDEGVKEKVISFRQMGLTFRDIADSLGISKTSIHRILKKLT